MLTRFFEGPPLGNFCFKTSPLSRNSGLVERKRPGREEVLWTFVDNISPANHIDCISLVDSNIMHCCIGPRTTVTLIFLQFKWLPRLTWGEKCSKIPKVQILHYEMGNPFRRANLRYRLVFRCAEEGQISGFDPLLRKNIGFWPSSAQKNSQNTENVDITTKIRPDTRKFSFGIAPLESALLERWIHLPVFWFLQILVTNGSEI